MISKMLGRKLGLVREQTKQKKPALACDQNSGFVYQSGADVQKTWKKYGWTAPSEYRNDYEFAKNRECK